MSKIDIIDYCGDCSRRYYKANDIFCKMTDKETQNWPIPEWCPLPDAPLKPGSQLDGEKKAQYETVGQTLRRLAKEIELAEIRQQLQH
jgi:hypothetical protein